MRRIVNIRMIVFAALGFGAGIFLCSLFSGFGALPLYLIAGIGLPLAVLSAVLAIRGNARKGRAAAFFHRYGASFAAALLLFVLGAGAFAGAVSAFERDAFGCTEGTATGRIVAADIRDGRATLTLERVELTSMNVTVSLKGRTQLTVTGDTLSGVGVGDWFTASGRIWGNPIVKDGKIDGYAYKRNIRYRMEADFRDTYSAPGNRTALESMRRGLYELLLKNMAPELAGTAYGILMGDTSYIPSGDLGAFRTAGIAHIFAVSGLHVGFLVGACGWLLKKLRLHPAARFLAVAALLAFYASLTGLSGSVVRASVMFLTLYFARMAGARYDGLTALGAAFLVTLSAAPLLLFETGFLMSYSVMLSLLSLSGPLAKAFSRGGKGGKVSRAFAASLSAEIGIIPVSVAYFHTLNPFGALVNLVFLPVTGALFLSLALFSLLAAALPFTGVLLKIPEIMIFASVFFARTAAAVPYAEIVLYTFSGFAALYYAAIFFGSRFCLLRGRGKRVLCLVAAVCFASGLTVWELAPLPPRTDAITLFGTQYEQNALLETATGERIFVNTAPSYHCGDVTEFFAERRIRRLDAVVIPSPKARYLDTLAILTERCEVKTAYLPYSELPHHQAAYALIEASGIEVRFLEEGKLTIGGAELYVYADTEAFAFSYKSLLYCLSLTPERVERLLREAGDCRVLRAEEFQTQLARAFGPRVVLSHTERLGVTQAYYSVQRCGVLREKLS